MRGRGATALGALVELRRAPTVRATAHQGLGLGGAAFWDCHGFGKFLRSIDFELVQRAPVVGVGIFPGVRIEWLERRFLAKVSSCRALAGGRGAIREGFVAAREAREGEENILPQGIRQIDNRRVFKGQEQRMVAQIDGKWEGFKAPDTGQLKLLHEAAPE